jgi:hypothetical protein
MNEMNEGWEEVQAGNFWNPKKEGESVEGIIISIEQGQWGNKVTMETKDKKLVTLPNHAVLQSRIQNCKTGDMIKVVFEKTELPTVKGHNPTNIYKVLKKTI